MSLHIWNKTIFQNWGSSYNNIGTIKVPIITNRFRILQEHVRKDYCNVTYPLKLRKRILKKQKESKVVFSFFPTWLFVSWPGFNQRMVKIDLETKNDNNKDYSKKAKNYFNSYFHLI